MNKAMLTLFNAIHRFYSLPWALSDDQIELLFSERESVLLSSYRQKIVENIIYGNLTITDGIPGYFQDTKGTSESVSDKYLPEGFERNRRDHDAFRLETQICQDLEYQPSGVLFKREIVYIKCVPVCSMSYEYLDGHIEAGNMSCVYCNRLPEEGSLEHKQVEKIIRMMVEIDHKHEGALLRLLENDKDKIEYKQLDDGGSRNNEYQDARRQQMLRIYNEYLAG